MQSDVMKRMIVILFIGVTLLSCGNDDVKINLNEKDDLEFIGTFKTINSENLSGTVSLRFTDGHYECTTSLPFGLGAGKLQTNETTINFVDTLFFAIPAIHGPSYVLSGEHNYDFDGENLRIWRAKNVGSVEYKLKLVK
jgi:hypothetical protein